MNSVVTAVSDTRTSWRLASVLALTGIAAIAFVGLAAIPYYLSASYGPPEYAPIRSYVVTFAFVLFRLLQPMFQNIGTVAEQLAAAGWPCWTIPLLTTELVLQGRTILRVRA